MTAHVISNNQIRVSYLMKLITNKKLMSKTKNRKNCNNQKLQMILILIKLLLIDLTTRIERNVNKEES